MFGVNAFGQPYFAQGPLQESVSGSGAAILPLVVASGDGFVGVEGSGSSIIPLPLVNGVGAIINPVPVVGGGGTGRVGVTDDSLWEVATLKKPKIPAVVGTGSASLSLIRVDAWGFAKNPPRIYGRGSAVVPIENAHGDGEWHPAKWLLLEDDWLLDLVNDMDLVRV